MKDSKQYADNLSKFWRKAKPKGKIEKPAYVDPVDAMVYATLLEKYGPAKTDKFLKKLDHNFVDWNDLRVSRDEEIIEVLGGESELNHSVASGLRNSLQAAFERNDCLELNYIIEYGKRKAQEELEKFNALTDFVLSYVMLVCLDAHSIPVNDKMIEFLKSSELVSQDSMLAEIKGFLERQVPAAQNYLFFHTLMAISEKPVKAVAAVKTTVKKVSKKKTTKKAVKKAVKKTTKKVTKKKTTKKK